MSIKPTWKDRDEVEENGWFSRRHKTNKEHLEVKEARAIKTSIRNFREGKKTSHKEIMNLLK